ALYERHCDSSRFRLLHVWTLDEARRLFRGLKPRAVLLDVGLEEGQGWTFLKELKDDPAFQEIPVLVLTLLDAEDRALALGAADLGRKPGSQRWLLDRLERADQNARPTKVLVIDDLGTDRYLIRQQLLTLDRYTVIEAADGAEGLRSARVDRPDLIVLDLVL